MLQRGSIQMVIPSQETAIKMRFRASGRVALCCITHWTFTVTTVPIAQLNIITAVHEALPAGDGTANKIARQRNDSRFRFQGGVLHYRVNGIGSVNPGLVIGNHEQKIGARTVVVNRPTPEFAIKRPL
jgi:hypothetical protein